MEFSDQDRAIFRYFDGERLVHGDPLDLIRRANHFSGEGDINIVARKTGPQATPDERFEAWEKLASAVRQAFEMAPFDKGSGTGATFTQVCKVWEEFTQFLENLKKNSGQSPTSLPPSEPVESSQTPLPTPCSSGCP